MSAIRIQNDAGRFFTVKIVRNGDTYGLNHCLTHDSDDALIEFYDATYADDDSYDNEVVRARIDVMPSYDSEGQFVVRYYASTLLGEGMLAFDDKRGLSLHGGVDVWQIDAAGMAVVKAFIRANR